MTWFNILLPHNCHQLLSLGPSLGGLKIKTLKSMNSENKDLKSDTNSLRTQPELSKAKITYMKLNEITGEFSVHIWTHKSVYIFQLFFCKFCGIFLV